MVQIKANEKYLLSVAEASPYFGIGRDTLYHLIKTDPTLPTTKIGSTTKINRPLMEKWLDEATKEGRQL